MPLHIKLSSRNLSVLEKQTASVFQGTVRRAQRHCDQLLRPTAVPLAFGIARTMPTHGRNRLLHLQFRG